MSSGAVRRPLKGTSATQRLKQDYIRLMRDPVPYVSAHPLPNNILEWHYVVRGPEGTPYHGGIYQGKLQFPSEFPFKPPAIYMLTPNGRFKCNVRLCLSISDFHPDTWNPAWSVATILTGLLSFMVEKNPTMGSIETSDYEKKVLAQKSLEFNLANKVFLELFPDVAQEIRDILVQRRQSADNNTVSARVNELRNTLSSGLRANPENGFFGSTVANLVVIVGFVAFLFTVRWVITTINEDN